MDDLVTARDIENKVFGRSIRGYSVDEVDEFLDRIAEDIQTYSLRAAELERTVDRLEEQIQDYVKMKDTLQETLLMAQQSAASKEEAAARKAEAILSEAKIKAEQLTLEASSAKDRGRTEIQRLRQMRQEFRAEFRALLSRYGALLEGDETEDAAREAQTAQ